MKNIFYIFILFLSVSFSCSVFSQSIDSAEYFFDSDPGIGNGFQLSVAKGDTVTDTVNAVSAGLPQGFHTLFIRLRDTNGTWSLYEGKTFYLNDTIVSAASASFDSTNAESFFNSDPGVGNGTALAFSPGDSLYDTVIISTTGLTSGFHNFFARVKDSAGKWSLYDDGRFYLYDTVQQSAPSTAPLAYAEYFYNTDPGTGNGIPVTAFLAADTIMVTDTFPSAPLAAGKHNLFVRVRDTANTWSLYEWKVFTVCNFVPAPDFTADTVCLGTPTSFTDLTTNLDTSVNFQYGWDFDGDSVPDDTTKGSTSHIFSDTGPHNVILIVDNLNGCADTVMKTVYVDSLPVVTLILPVDTACKDDTVMLSGGNPPGGFYSGNGVYNNTFYADSVSSGLHQIGYTYYNSDSCSSTKYDKIFVSHCTGISDYETANIKFEINPNPFRDATTITLDRKLKSAELIIFDVFGKEIRKFEIRSQRIQIAREGMAAGIYVVKIVAKGNNHSSTMLVVSD